MFLLLLLLHLVLLLLLMLAPSLILLHLLPPCGCRPKVVRVVWVVWVVRTWQMGTQAIEDGSDGGRGGRDRGEEQLCREEGNKTIGGDHPRQDIEEEDVVGVSPSLLPNPRGPEPKLQNHHLSDKISWTMSHSPELWGCSPHGF